MLGHRREPDLLPRLPLMPRLRPLVLPPAPGGSLTMWLAIGLFAGALIGLLAGYLIAALRPPEVP